MKISEEERLKNMGKKLCPLRSIGIQDGDVADCAEELCQWWGVGYNDCAMLDIAGALTDYVRGGNYE